MKYIRQGLHFFFCFLSAQQHQVKYNQEQNWDCDQILQMLRHQAISV
jgi:hypothetical protein